MQKKLIIFFMIFALASTACNKAEVNKLPDDFESIEGNWVVYNWIKLNDFGVNLMERREDWLFYELQVKGMEYIATKNGGVIKKSEYEVLPEVINGNSLFSINDWQKKKRDQGSSKFLQHFIIRNQDTMRLAAKNYLGEVIEMYREP